MNDSIAIISDIHVKSAQDKAYNLLMSFLGHELVKSSRALYLLGDIFDCMAGRQREYIDIYRDYFECIGKHLKAGREIYYFQGNHDVHVELNYRDYFKQNNIDDHLFFYHNRPLVQQIWGKTFLFAHGDEIELGNWKHKVYRFVTTGSAAKFFVENIIRHKVIHYFAEWASKKSRKRNQRYDSNLVQEKFRKIAMVQAAKGYDYVICGHSHIKDDYTYCRKEGGDLTYLNNGFPLESNCFIHLSKDQHSFVKLLS